LSQKLRWQKNLKEKMHKVFNNPIPYKSNLCFKKIILK